MLKGKKVVVGISGGIASYKIPYLIRCFIKVGCQVKVIATKNALEFVTLTTLQTLSKNDVYYEIFSEHHSYSTEHISITDWADFIVVAPATANIIGKYASGIADDALSTSLLAFDKEVFIAPAMNTKMYNNIAVKENIETLHKRGVEIIFPRNGELACGYDGDGRMQESDEIFDYINNFYANHQNLVGKTILVTAGPTYEQIDAVRFIGNHSSGKMGFCIAEILAKEGANVILISGPTHLEVKYSNIKRIDVLSADDMYNETLKYFSNCDVAILSAAVADYKPVQISGKKIKKTDQSLTITLESTQDILKTLGQNKTESQILVGFALETDNELENAKLKLKNKNLDFIVLNSLNDSGAGFRTPTNKITIIDSNSNIESFPLKTKEEVAEDIVKKLISLF